MRWILFAPVLFSFGKRNAPPQISCFLHWLAGGGRGGEYRVRCPGGGSGSAGTPFLDSRGGHADVDPLGSGPLPGPNHPNWTQNYRGVSRVNRPSITRAIDSGKIVWAKWVTFADTKLNSVLNIGRGSVTARTLPKYVSVQFGETLPNAAVERDAHRQIRAPEWSTAAVTRLGCSVGGPCLGSVYSYAERCSDRGPEGSILYSRIRRISSSYNKKWQKGRLPHAQLELLTERTKNKTHTAMLTTFKYAGQT